MILVDTSVWADHFRQGDVGLTAWLERRLVAMHPFVVGELALGHLRPRATILRNLRALPGAPMAADSQVLDLIEVEGLVGQGIGYVDAHLLASVRLGAGIRLWTRDRRLRATAGRMGLAFDDDG